MVSPILAALGVGVGLYLLKKKQPAMIPFPTTAPPGSQPPAERPPQTPPSMGELQTAERLAGEIDADVRAKGRGTNVVTGGVLIQGTGYNQDRVKQFQRLARLTIDGLYGPKTAGAVGYFIKRDPAPAIYSDARGRRTPVPYTPPN